MYVRLRRLWRSSARRYVQEQRCQCGRVAVVGLRRYDLASPEIFLYKCAIKLPGMSMLNRSPRGFASVACER
jgi:hypothetical protein